MKGKRERKLGGEWEAGPYEEGRREAERQQERHSTDGEGSQASIFAPPRDWSEKTWPDATTSTDHTPQEGIVLYICSIT